MKKLSEHVRTLNNTRSSIDRRKKVDRYIMEYRDGQNVPYRKSYEFPVMTKYEDVIKSIPKEYES